MNKKNTRKGFTIVELVIVIAVIAILATVLVPTFGNVISDAQKTALKQELKNAHTQFAIAVAASGVDTDEVVIKHENKYYSFKAGNLELNTDNSAKELDATAVADLKEYWDAKDNCMMHAYEAVGGTGTDKDNCQHCDATAAHDGFVKTK